MTSGEQKPLGCTEQKASSYMQKASSSRNPNPFSSGKSGNSASSDSSSQVDALHGFEDGSCLDEIVPPPDYSCDSYKRIESSHIVSKSAPHGPSDEKGYGFCNSPKDNVDNRAQNALLEVSSPAKTGIRRGRGGLNSFLGTLTEDVVVEKRAAENIDNSIAQEQDTSIPREYHERREELKRWLQVNGPPDPAATPGFVGLKNQGATCYLNSLLQSFYCLPEFRNAIAEWRFDPLKHGTEEMCIPYQIQLLFAHLRCSRKNAVSTTGFTKACGFTQSDVFQQHDVQELCRILFDALERSDKDLFNKLQALFEVNTTEFLRSTNTDKEYRSEKTAKNLDISVPLEDKDETLEEALSRVISTEEMTGENRWFCEEAGMKIDAERGVRFEHFPDVLAIHLMRFVYDRTTFRRKKLTKDVDIPLELDLTELNSKAGIYTLCAVCFHTGSGYGGHYFAWTRGPNDDMWTVCNDERKALLDFGSLDKSGRLKGDLNAPYFLLYRRKALAVPPMVENPHEATFLKKENEEFDDMQKLYEIHLDIRPIRILSMQDHRQRVNARISRWLRQYELQMQIELPPDDEERYEPPNGREVEVRSAQLLCELEENLYIYDQSSCTADREVDKHATAVDCRGSLLSCPSGTTVPRGTTTVLLWKDGKFDYDNVRQCASDAIETVAKEMYSEPAELLVISNSYSINNAKVERLPRAWRRAEFVIVDTAYSSNSGSDRDGSENENDNEDNEDSAMCNGVMSPVKDKKTSSLGPSFREVFDNCVNGLIVEHSRVNSGQADETIVAKRQWKASELKAAICAKYGLDPAKHHLKRSAKSQMIKDESQSLDYLSFSNRTAVFLCTGPVVKVGHIYLDIALQEKDKIIPMHVGTIVCPDTIKGEDFRAKVFDLFMEEPRVCATKQGKTLTNARQIRIRSDTQFGAVFRDGTMLRSQHLIDGKTMVAQIMPEAEDLTGCTVAPVRVLDLERESTNTIPARDVVVRAPTVWSNVVEAVHEVVQEHVDGIDDVEIAAVQSYNPRISFLDADTYDWHSISEAGHTSIRDSTALLARSRSGYKEWKDKRRKIQPSPSKIRQEDSPICMPSSYSSREKALVISVSVPDTKNNHVT